jgi:hypothetical protein
MGNLRLSTADWISVVSVPLVVRSQTDALCGFKSWGTRLLQELIYATRQAGSASC